MPKNIDQLAEEYVNSTLVGSSYVKKMAFITGANAVLYEIMNIINNNVDISKDKQYIIDKINELKR